MSKRLLIAGLLVAAALVGSALGLAGTKTTVFAGNDNLRWMAGTFVGSDPDARFCFGYLGWHQANEGGQAGDIFYDGDNTCYGPGPSGVWASNRGLTTVYPTYHLLGWANNPGTSTACTDVSVATYWYNGGWVLLGYEWYEHTQGGPAIADGEYYNIYIGQGYWANSSLYLGQTVDDTGKCAWDGWHLHQSIYDPLNETWIYHTHNIPLTANVSYDQDDPAFFIHNWTGW